MTNWMLQYLPFYGQLQTSQVGLVGAGAKLWWGNGTKCAKMVNDGDNHCITSGKCAIRWKSPGRCWTKAAVVREGDVTIRKDADRRSCSGHTLDRRRLISQCPFPERATRNANWGGQQSTTLQGGNSDGRSAPTAGPASAEWSGWKGGLEGSLLGPALPPVPAWTMPQVTAPIIQVGGRMVVRALGVLSGSNWRERASGIRVGGRHFWVLAKWRWRFPATVKKQWRWVEEGSCF